MRLSRPNSCQAPFLSFCFAGGHDASTQAATTRRCTYMRSLRHLRVCCGVLYESKHRKAKHRVTDTVDTIHSLLTVLDASRDAFSSIFERIYQGGMFTGVC